MMALLYAPLLVLVLAILPEGAFAGRRLFQLTSLTSTPTESLTVIPTHTSSPTLTIIPTHTSSATSSATGTYSHTPTSTAVKVSPFVRTRSSSPTVTSTQTFALRNHTATPSPTLTNATTSSPTYLQLNYTYSSKNVVILSQLNTGSQLVVNFTCDRNTVDSSINIIQYKSSNAASHSAVCAVPKMIYTNCTSFYLTMKCSVATAHSKFHIADVGPGNINLAFQSVPSSSNTGGTGSGNSSDLSLLYLLFLLLLIPLLLLLLWLLWRRYYKSEEDKQVVVGYIYPWLDMSSHLDLPMAPSTPAGGILEVAVEGTPISMVHPLGSTYAMPTHLNPMHSTYRPMQTMLGKDQFPTKTTGAKVFSNEQDRFAIYSDPIPVVREDLPSHMSSHLSKKTQFYDHGEGPEVPDPFPQRPPTANYAGPNHARPSTIHPASYMRPYQEVLQPEPLRSPTHRTNLERSASPYGDPFNQELNQIQWY